MKKNKALSPLMWALAGLVGGIYLQSFANIAPQFFAVPGIMIVLLVFIALKKRLGTLLLATAILAGAWFGAFLFAIQKNNYQQARDALEECGTITLEGTIADIEMWPSVYQGKIIRININHVNGIENLLVDRYCTTCFFRHTEKTFRVGDNIQAAELRFKKDEKNDSKNSNSYENYLIKEGIIFSSFLQDDEKLLLTSRPTFHFRRLLWEWRQSMYEKLEKMLNKKTFKYMALIFLGNRKQDDLDSMRNMFNRWGLAHYLARAGLHIVIFIFLWTLLLRLIPIHLIIKRIILLLLCIFYDLLSWTSLPFFRAFYAFILANMGLLTGKQTNTVHLLTLICMFILLCNPIQLFFLDFQLTFALTFLLLFL